MTRTGKIVAALLALAVGIPPVAALAVPLARAGGAPAWLDLPFRLICHGLDARSIEVFGYPMPICARCFAIYLGAIAAVGAFLTVPLLQRAALPTLVLIAALIPMAIDGTTQAFTLRESNNVLRIASGLPAGFAFLLWTLGRIERQARMPDGESELSSRA